MVDAFRVESLTESEQAAGMASYVAAYRIGMLASTAGALFIVSGFEAAGLGRGGVERRLCRHGGTGALGVATTLMRDRAANNPPRREAVAHARKVPFGASSKRRVGAFSDFLTRDMAFVALAFVVLVQVHRRAGRRDDRRRS